MFYRTNELIGFPSGIINEGCSIYCCFLPAVFFLIGNVTFFNLSIEICSTSPHPPNLASPAAPPPCLLLKIALFLSEASRCGCPGFADKHVRYRGTPPWPPSQTPPPIHVILLRWSGHHCFRHYLAGCLGARAGVCTASGQGSVTPGPWSLWSCISLVAGATRSLFRGGATV